MATTLRPPPRADAPTQPGLGPLGTLRFLWRQLTSMRTALFLLFLLALGAIPGSLVPQNGVNPSAVAQFRLDHPVLAPVLDRLSLFDVYSAPWFAAIYLLLLVSLVGCVMPRARLHWHAVRAAPPALPRNLARLPVHERWETDASPEEVAAAARSLLRGRRFRTATHEAGPSGRGVSAEKGHLREVGNLVFHTALIGLLFGMATSGLYGWRAGELVVEGEGFSGTLAVFDSFEAGPLVDPETLPPFTLTLDELSVSYQETGAQRGAPRDFTARTTVREVPGAPEDERVLRVNAPLHLGSGTKAFLIGNGYAPVVTVRDASGEVAFAGPVPFLPQNGNNDSTGVVKVTGAQPEQLGLQGFFLPTAEVSETSELASPLSSFPDLDNPLLFLTTYRGDLGVGSGVPQSVYRLDTAAMEELTTVTGRPVDLAPGETVELPEGAGTVTLEGVRRWASLSIAHDPGKTPSLVAAVLTVLGLTGSLFVRHRRVWVAATTGPGGRTVVEVAGLARSGVEGLRDEVERLVSQLRQHAPTTTTGTAGAGTMTEE